MQLNPITRQTTAKACIDRLLILFIFQFGGEDLLAGDLLDEEEEEEEDDENEERSWKR